MRIISTVRLNLFVMLAMTFFLFWSNITDAAEWKDPKEYFNDPTKVRLARGQKELTDTEKHEIKTYGLTALELITYLYYNQEAGSYDKDCLARFYNILPSGKIFRTELLDRLKYYYDGELELITLNRLKPKDTYRK